jgi:hypothetical protein
MVRELYSCLNINCLRIPFTAKHRSVLQSLTPRFCRLSCLFIADVGVADRGADILMAEEFLDFPQITGAAVADRAFLRRRASLNKLLTPSLTNNSRRPRPNSRVTRGHLDCKRRVYSAKLMFFGGHGDLF